MHFQAQHSRGNTIGSVDGEKLGEIDLPGIARSDITAKFVPEAGEDQVQARLQIMEKGFQAEALFSIEMDIAHLKGVRGQVRTLVVEFFDGGHALGAADADARGQLIGDGHKRADGCGPGVKGSVYIQAHIGNNIGVRIKGGVGVAGGGLKFDLTIGELVIEADGGVLFSRGRGEDKGAQFEVAVFKAGGKHGVSRLVLCVQVQFEIAAVVVEQKLGPDAAAGFELEVMIEGLRETRLYAADHPAVETVDCPAVQDPAQDIQVCAVGVTADKSAGNTVLSAELIERSADIASIGRVGQTDGVGAGVDGGIVEFANGGLHVPGIAVRGFGIKCERAYGRGDGGG